MVTPTQSISAAINAYKSAATSADRSSGASEASQAAPTEDFGSLVRDAIDEAVRIGNRSEEMSIKGVNNQADLNDVVTAVSEAEVTLETVKAIRDKVIDAYQQVIRMPI